MESPLKQRLFVFFALGIPLFLTLPQRGDARTQSDQLPTVTKLEKNLSHELMETARRGDLDGVSSLIASGAIVNSREEETGTTPLIQGVLSGSIAIVQLLVNEGAAMDIQDKMGMTALMHASQWGRTEMVRTLLAAHADPLKRNQKGFTAKQFAGFGKHYRITAILDIMERRWQRRLAGGP